MFKNLGNLTQIAGMLKNVGQMKEKIAKSKERLATERVTGEVPGGSVRIEMNGLGEVLQVAVAPEMLTPAMQNQLERSIQQATNIAINNAKQLHLASIREITGGIDIPGMDGVLEELTK